MPEIDVQKLTLGKKNYYRNWGVATGERNDENQEDANMEHSQVGGKTVADKQVKEAYDGAEELHSALKASKEIKRSQNLYSFIRELKSKHGVKIA